MISPMMLCIALAGESLPPVISVIPSPPDRVILEAHWETVSIARDSSGRLRVIAPSLAYAMPVGSPDLPHGAVAVALPPRGDYEVSAFPSGVTSHTGLIAAVDDTLRTGTMRVPQTWHAVTAEGWLRHQRMMELTLFPAIPSPMGLSTARRVRVEIRFTDIGIGGGTVKEEPSFEAVYRVAVNHQQATAWRATPPVTLRRDPVLPPEHAVKVYVDRRGITALSGADMEIAGIDISTVDPSTLRLTCRGEDVPYAFTGLGTHILSPTDSLLFFGHPNYRADEGCRLVDWWDHFSAANVYWLSWGEAPGIRFTQRPAAPSGAHPVVEWHAAVAHAEQDLLAFLSNEGDAPWPTEWYWQRWSAGTQGVTKDFTVVVDSPRPTQSALLLRASLHGYSNLSGVQWQYHTTFALNGNPLGDVYWGQWNGRVPFCYDSQQQGDLIQAEWIQQGTNTFAVRLLPDIDPEKGPLSTAYFDSWSLRYDRILKAVQDTLEFEAPPGTGAGMRTFRVQGVSTADVVLLDMVRQERLIGADHIGTTLTFETSVADSTRFALASRARLVQPLKIVKERPADPPLSSGDAQAAYLIISYDREEAGDADPYHNLFDAAINLALARDAVVPTRVFDVQDIYDEFNWGIIDPEAIRDFLKHAFSTWSLVPPEYVLFFGDASWDYLGRSGPTAKKSFVPCWGYPISENHFVELSDGDFFPDLHIGRLPVENSFQADNAVAKVLAYPAPYQEDETWRKRALMVVGGFTDSEQTIFESHAESILTGYVLPAPFLGDPSRVYRSLTGYQPGYYNQRIVDAINDGCVALNYIGHGAALTWGIMFDVMDVGSLTNDLSLPVTMGLTCNSNAFGEPDTSCLGEVFLRLGDPAHGAIASWGATARANEYSAWRGSLAFFQALCIDLERRVGPLTTAGKIAGGSSVWTMFSLLGEPLVELPVPTGPDLVINEDSLSVTPSVVGENHDVAIDVVVENHGRASPEQVIVRFAAGPEGSSSEIAAVSDTCGMRRRSPYTVTWNTGAGLGPRIVSASADHLDVMAELREDNNVATLPFEALLAPPSVAAPFDCQVSTTASVWLTVNNLPGQSTGRTYEFQIARTDSFTPSSPGFASSGAVSQQQGSTGWSPPGLMQGTTYFWRCKAMEGSYDGAWSPTASVTIDTTASGTVWAQRHGAQFAADSLAQLVVDRELHTVVLRAQVNPTDYAHVDQGATVPFVSSYMTQPYTDPLNLIGEDIGSGAGQYGQFLFANNDYAQEALIDLGQERTIGIVGSEHWIGLDDRPVWSFYRISSSLNNVDFEEWGALGPYTLPSLGNVPTPMFFSVETPRPVKFLRFQFGQGLPHPFPGGALWGSRIYEVFAYAVDFLPSGTLTSSAAGPAASWQQATWDADIPPGASFTVTVLSSSTATGQFLPVQGLGGLSASPVDLNAITDPYVKLVGTASTTDPRVTPALHQWRLRFQGGVDMAFRGGLSVTPPLPPAGSVAQIGGVMVNQGISTADTVRFLLRDTTTSAAVDIMDTLLIGLQPGAVWQFAVPWLSTIGRHTVTASAEVRGGAPEVAPGDNEAAVEVVVLPDPACLALRAVTPQPQQYGALLLEGIIGNQGSVLTDSVPWVLESKGPDAAAFVAVDSGATGFVTPGESIAVAIQWPPPRTPGMHDLLFAVAYSGEQVSIANDTVEISIRIAGAADLVIDSLAFSNSQPPAGDPVEVRLRVLNVGEAGVDSVFLVLFHTPPGGDEAALAVWELSVEGGQARAMEATFVTSGLPGLHRIRAVADPDDVIPEADEGNNSRADSITVLSGADLLCTGLSLAPLPVLTRDTVVAFATVRNAGEIAVGSFELAWEAAELRLLAGDGTVGGLDGTSEEQVSATFLAPSVPAEGVIRLMIDAPDSVEETNEGNNVAESAVGIVAEPDLAVRSDEVRFDPSAPTEDDTVAVRFVVRNSGGAPSEEFLVSVAHRPGGSGAWTEFFASTFSSIAPGGFAEGHAAWIADDYRLTHWFCVTCNPDSAARERRLDNNSAERSLIVSPKDRDPPVITLAVALPGFGDSAWVPPMVPVISHLTDAETGIDTASVTVYVDDETYPVTPVWQVVDPGLRLETTVGPLAPGLHALRLEGADQAANRGVSPTVMVTVAEEAAGISLVAMQRDHLDETVFVVRCAFEESAELGVYTVSGRLLMRWGGEIAPPMTMVCWDRRDRDGDRVANGVYFVRAETQSGHRATTTMALLR